MLSAAENHVNNNVQISNFKVKSFLIAAPMSGSGKTTVARGLMALLKREGHTVQPMKCGPDYIDTKFHTAVCGRPSINLDSFMATDNHIKHLFEHHASDADICIVEGMMGLFDGYDHEHGSAYEIARILQLPVVLVINAQSAAYSMAALISGFINFKSDIRIIGVIFNKVGSERHQRMLEEVCQDVGVRCLGCLPKTKDAETGERYLGLDFSNGATGMESTFNTLANLIERHIDWKTIILLANDQRFDFSKTQQDETSKTKYKRIAIAQSPEAFSFIYQSTLDAMQGAELHFFNPELNETFPADVDMLYLPGGYPEKHAEALTKASATRACIKAYADKGGHIIAECGGMMYLCEEILTDEGTFPFCGVLPYKISARKSDRHLSLGYRQWTLNGKEYRGHEFHYSQFAGITPPSVTTVLNARGEPVNCPIIQQGNVLASYTHWYWQDAFGL